MAITSVLGGQGRISDATLTAMLNSGDQNLINQANDYIEGARKEAEELGKNKGILGVISDLFGFSKLAAAEPEMPSSKKSSNQFSVTQEPQFQLRDVPEVPGTNVMTGSVMENIIDTPTREFGDMLVGRDDQAIFGDSTGQRFSVDNNPELFFNTAAGQAKADEEKNFFDYLQNLSGGAVNFAKDITGRVIASNVGAATLGKFNPILGTAAGI